MLKNITNIPYCLKSFGWAINLDFGLLSPDQYIKEYLKNLILRRHLEFKDYI